MPSLHIKRALAALGILALASVSSSGSLRANGGPLPGQPVSLVDFSGSTVARLKSAAAALTARGGGTLLIPRGTYNLASSELRVPVLLPSNISVDGQGAQFNITGTTVTGSLFRAENASDIVIKNLAVTGNNRAITDSSSGAFFNHVQNSAGTGAHDIRIDNVRLQNFKAERWISFLNNHPKAPVTGIKITNLSAVSEAGNNLGGNDIGISASILFFYGVTADIEDVEIDGLRAEAGFIKSGVTLHHRVKNVRIDSPSISNAGQDGTADDKGAYAINCYADPGEETGLTINDAVINAPRSAGIYLRGCSNVVINRPKISGQTDIAFATLPKGAVATNGSSNVRINGGTLSNNAVGAYLVARAGSSAFDIEMNGTAISGAGRGVIINPGSGAGVPSAARFINCAVSVGSQALQQLNEFRTVKNLVVSGGSWVSKNRTALELNPFDGGALVGYVIDNVTIGANNRGIDIASPAATATGDVTISNSVIYDSGSNSLIYGIQAQNFPSINIYNTLIRDMGTGYATYLVGAHGKVSNVNIRNVINGHGPGGLKIPKSHVGVRK